MLVGLRDFQDDKADVLLRYNPDEARNLKTYGELPEEGVPRNLSLSLSHTHTHTHPWLGADCNYMGRPLTGSFTGLEGTVI